MSDPSRFSELEMSGRDIPSFIEPRLPVVLHPFMRPRPKKGTNLLELFEEDSECEEPDLVQVYLRLKPCNATITNLYEVRSERCLITSLDTTTAGHGRRTQHNVSKMYTFSHIFRSDSSQKEIFEHVVKDNLKKLTEGHSFTLLTYGASGSGKTFTLMGTVAAPGLVPRSLEYVFNIVEAAQRPCYKPSETGADVLSKAEQDYELKWVKSLRQVSAPLRDKYRRMSASLHSTITNSYIDLSSRTKNYVWVSFIEIYNEGIYDLLVPCDRRAASKLAIREDSSGNVYVKGATQAFVRSGEEAYDVMVAGKHNLQVAATGVHAQSSRSHCIFTITMLTEIDGEVRSACVRLCDLAGCERVARTRNTGARMQESRAINSSLHVLERCLHTLRRKQAGRRALVPYRESKLTRLLGAGLSGARGEAVSMVVTLNPAPEYAHETRHVLQLAAVAKDIQVNNTIAEYPSSLETSQDTTLGPSAEVMRLRADNERLRFELARSEAFYKEQLARMEEKEAAAVGHCDTWALVQEAKQITKEYYEERILTLRKQNEEKAAEQENKIAELLVNITVLEELLSAEKLSRARAEEEVVHLRSCIEERDEKPDENEHTEDVIDVNDSETSDYEDDPCNESLEPTFKKEEINRSKMIRQSLQHEAKGSDVEKSFNVSNESVLEKSTETLKDQESDDDSNNDSAVDNTYATSTEASDGNSNIVYQYENISEKKQSDIKETTQDDIFAEKYETTKSKNNNSILGSTSLISRSTYSVMKDNSLYESSVEVNNESDYKFIKNNLSHVKETTVKEEIPKHNDSFKVPDKPFVYSIINSFKNPIQSNNSLAQFESLEKATKDYDISKQEVNIEIDKIKILKEKRHFFDSELKSDKVCSIKSYVNMAVDNTNVSKENRNLFDSEVKSNDACSTKSSVNMPVDNMNITKDNRCFFGSEVNFNDACSTKSDVNMAGDNVNISNERKKYFVEVKSKDACSTKSDVNMAVDNIDISKEKINFFDSEVKSKDACCTKSDVNMTIDNKYISKEKINFFDSEVKSKDISCIKSNVNITVDNKNISKEKINFDGETKSYDSSSTSDSKENVENKTFFEDTHQKIKDKIHSNLKKNCDDYRSPSIVKDDLCTIDFEPQRIKKLLGENNITPIEPISSIKKSYFSKEHNSMDVFDSPQVQYTLDELPSIDDIRRSMSKVNISNNKNDMKNGNDTHENNNLTLQTTNNESLLKSSIRLESDQLPSIDDIRRSIVKENISRKNKESKNQSDAQEKNNLNLKVSTHESLQKYSKSQLLSIDDIRESIAKENTSNKSDVHRIKNNALENNSLTLKISNQESLILKEKNHVSNSKCADNVRNNVKTTTENINDTEIENVVEINGSKRDLEVTNIKVDSTLEEFENIYKEITIPRSTEFDLLYTSNQNEAQISETNNIEQENVDIENARYNLRKNMSKTERKPRKTKTKCLEGEILMESVSKCESSSKFTKRNLRLRRRKNASDDDFVEPEKEEKLKDIANLQSEFSDITMDVPARPKVVNVISSLEKEEENVCPTLGIQSCPSKMSTRRRKLFTPRAEPLDESVASGDCDVRVRVPRPSYHRPRARRKL